ncbi:hypothetical protein OROGR_001107 [Orobanche gracilis]
MQSVLDGNKVNEGVARYDSSKRTNMTVGKGSIFSRHFDGLFGRKFGGPKSRRVESSGKMEPRGVEVRKNEKLANILVAPVEKVTLNSALNADLGNKRGSMLDDTLESTVRAENCFDATKMENIAVENKMMDAAEINGTTSEAFFNQTIYSYRNKTSKFVKNQKVHFKDYQDGMGTMPSNTNWGIALTFRAQLIADIGPMEFECCWGCRQIFVAAIEKFDTMISSSNFCAPDAIFRWGAALQHMSRLRPSRSREKVKLLQQARRLYEDALHMDLGNRPLQEALSS